MAEFFDVLIIGGGPAVDFDADGVTLQVDLDDSYYVEKDQCGNRAKRRRIQADEVQA